MTENEKLEYLKTQGIDADTGMRYADDSLDFYQELIGIFLEEYELKSQKVREAAKRMDKEYTVLVHGLKNNAKALGAFDLADAAFEHEKASKAGDKEYVTTNLRVLMDIWQKTIQIMDKMNN